MANRAGDAIFCGSKFTAEDLKREVDLKYRLWLKRRGLVDDTTATFNFGKKYDSVPGKLKAGETPGPESPDSCDP